MTPSSSARTTPSSTLEMDGAGNILLGGVHRRKPTKKTKPPTKKPIKVVYISNPMRVQTSASQFMALVQKLTGQDAEFPDPSKFPAAYNGGCLHKTVDADHNLSPLAVELPAEDLDSGDLESPAAAGSPDDSFYDAFDDLFPPPVIDSFSGFLPAALLHQSYARRIQ